MVKLMFAGVVSATLLGYSCTVNAWGGKKNDDEPAMPKGKDAADLGRQGFRQMAGDVGLLQDLLKDLEDPETMKEVEKLMKDKKFKKEMDAVMASEDWKTAGDDVSKFLSDPAAMNAVKKQTQEYTEFLASGPGKDGRKDASMGLDAAAMGMMDPGFMQDAMEMMKDPAVMKQVEETMKNPEFQKQMRSMMDNPAMRAQLAEAGANVEQLMKDPKLMAEAQRQMQNMMGGAAA